MHTSPPMPEQGNGNTNPFDLIPGHLRQTFANPQYVRALASDQPAVFSEIGRHYLVRSDNERNDSQALEDIIGLLKGCASDQGNVWQQDHRDACKTAISIIVAERGDIVSLPIEERVTFIGHCLEVIHSMDPAEHDPLGAPLSVFEAMGAIIDIGDTEDPVLSEAVYNAVLQAWVPHLADTRDQSAGGAITGDQARELAGRFLPYREYGPEEPIIQTPVTETVKNLLFAAGSEEAVLAACNGDIQSVIHEYIRAAAPRMRRLFGDNTELFQHTLQGGDTPDFYRAITTLCLKEYELWQQESNGLITDIQRSAQLEYHVRESNLARTSREQLPLDILQIRQELVPEFDPYCIEELDDRLLVSEAVGLDSLVDRLAQLQAVGKLSEILPAIFTQ